MAMQYSLGINGKVLFCMAILLLVTINLMDIAGASSNGRKLDYGVVRHGRHKPCTKANPQYCNKNEANPYGRGCNKATGCRGPRYDEEIIVRDNHNKLPIGSDLPSPVPKHHHSHHRHHHGHREKTNGDAYDNKSFE